jgi:hypothetical protein
LKIENCKQFGRFSDQEFDTLALRFEGAMENSQPVSRFARFFQRDVALGNEISATLRRVRLFEIRTNGSSRRRCLRARYTKIRRAFVNAPMKLQDSARKLKRTSAQIGTTSIFPVVSQFSISNF